MKSSKSKGKNNARTRKGLKPTSGGGAGVVGCIGSPAWKVGKKNRGSEDLIMNYVSISIAWLLDSVKVYNIIQ